VSLGRSGPGGRSGFLETPRTRFGGVFLASAQTGSQSAGPRDATPRVRQRSEAVDVDRGQLLGRCLEDVAVIVDLHELAPVGGRPAGGRERRWFERFAEVGEDLPDRSGLRDAGNEPDVAATRWALERELLADPGQEFRPGNPRRVVRAGFCMSVAAARGMRIVRMPTGTGIARLADVPDRQSRDGPSQLVIRRKHPVVSMPVPPRLRDQICKPVEELKRCELDDAAGPRLRGLPHAPRADPVGRLVPREHVTDATDAACGAADHGEPLQREGRPGTIAKKMLERSKIARHVAVEERDAGARVDRKPAVLRAART
jgi:hypothetical protein